MNAYEAELIDAIRQIQRGSFARHGHGLLYLFDQFPTDPQMVAARLTLERILGDDVTLIRN